MHFQINVMCINSYGKDKLTCQLWRNVSLWSVKSCWIQGYQLRDNISEMMLPREPLTAALIAVNTHNFTILNRLQIWQCEQTILFSQLMFWWSNVAHSTESKSFILWKHNINEQTFLFSGKSTQSNVKLM